MKSCFETLKKMLFWVSYPPKTALPKMVVRRFGSLALQNFWPSTVTSILAFSRVKEIRKSARGAYRWPADPFQYSSTSIPSACLCKHLAASSWKWSQRSCSSSPGWVCQTRTTLLSRPECYLSDCRSANIEIRFQKTSPNHWRKACMDRRLGIGIDRIEQWREEGGWRVRRTRMKRVEEW